MHPSADPGPPPELLTVAELALAARLSEKTIYRRARQGRLPHAERRAGEPYRFTLDALRTLTEPSAPPPRPSAPAASAPLRRPGGAAGRPAAWKSHLPAHR